eukprot:Nitzschia sp. Nitz4//scaffold215_size37433//12983//13873//NITZ4_007749-RA/size37433-processed-gene-0.48-mRNA-1//-1//CDS//3329542145//7729//frame0
MFRKPKKGVKGGNIRRRKLSEDEEDETRNKRTLSNNHSDGSDQEDDDAAPSVREVLQAHKRAKTSRTTASKEDDDTGDKGIMHHFDTKPVGATMSQQDLVTSTNQNHPLQSVDRGNKLLAAPIRAPTNIRTTCRFDYQPDICKDYKDTGFCGFGDTCIYLHDRGDTLSGWQLEQKWQQEQDLKKKKQQEEMDKFMNAANGESGNPTSIHSSEDGLPFACHLCRQPFTDPVVTTCQHYFCETCILQHVKETSTACPICNKDTHGVFHEPTKLLSKKRKIAGRNATWEQFMEACKNET